MNGGYQAAVDSPWLTSLAREHTRRSELDVRAVLCVAQSHDAAGDAARAAADQ